MAPHAPIAYRAAMAAVLSTLMLTTPVLPAIASPWAASPAIGDRVLWALALAGLGAIMGSFVAALVIRWPQGRSVARGRSACDACGRTLAPVDLVPVLSMLWLRGRCRRCGARIDPVHPITEVAALAIGGIAGALLPGGAGVASAVFGWTLLALAMLDWRLFWLPDRLTLALAAMGLAVALIGIGPPLGERLIGALAGWGGLTAIRLGYRRLRGREGMGGGDPKLFGAIGVWIGWRLLPVVLVLASMVGLGVVLFRLLSGRGAARDDRLPLGTLLAIAAYPAWLAMLLSGA